MVATFKERIRMMRKMADAAIACLSDAEFDSLTEWADDNLYCDVRYALQDGIKLVIAFDR